jgi:molecular chaperone GrpE
VTDPATEPVDGPDELDRPDEPAADPDDVLVAAPAVSAEIEVDPNPQEVDVDESDAVLDTALDDIDAFLAEEPDYLGDLQRVTAEFANFRKQTDKRNQELLARASMRLVEALLPVLDAFDAAALQEVDGVEPIHAQLLSVLGNEGLEVIAEVGESFDPNRHEAVMTEQAEEGEAGDEGTVVAEILRTGYAWKGRVFRPAMVKARG